MYRMIKIYKKSKLHRALIVIGLSGLLANNIALYYTFLRAYFNGYKTIVAINEVGEAHVEFIMLPILLVIGIWVIHILLKRV